MMRKNILILCGQYYPNVGAPMNCFLPYIKELQKDNNVCIINRKTDVVEYAGLIPIIQVTSWYNTLKLWCCDNIKRKKNQRISNVLLFLLRILFSIRTMLCLPTQNSWLIKKYKKAITEARKRMSHIDVIISVSYPFCAHIAALKYKEKNPGVRWITYTTDPYTFNESIFSHVMFKSYKKKWAFKKEKQIYDMADANIVTEDLYRMMVDSFNQSEIKTVPFPYLLTPQFQSEISQTVSNGNIVKCVYAGSLYHDIRNPSIMLQLFGNVNPNIKLIMYSDGDSVIKGILRANKSENICINGFVSRTVYENIIKNESDILINIGNSVELQSPSKLLELISTGKPVINFYYKEDIAHAIIEKYPLGINVSNKEFSTECVKIVEQFCRENKGKQLSYDSLRVIFPRHILENHMSVLNRLIRDSHKIVSW